MEVFSDSGNSIGKVPALCRYAGIQNLMWIKGHHQSKCGSEPARDSGVSVDISIDCFTAIASRLAPTGICGYWGIEGRP
ncbi:hypothetical protein CUN61_27140 [Pseudomonas arsenicoxydans]|uniref:Uncharacterized protein n=1 Tax=Pseudomonas arsenicoxydans TaxID=702115 RepID=A0A4P6G766_9PSED|nr:hypothetical protein CUN61_27140 [Pseudomonas arsenicoxydans]